MIEKYTDEKSGEQKINTNQKTEKIEELLLNVLLEVKEQNKLIFELLNNKEELLNKKEDEIQEMKKVIREKEMVEIEEEKELKELIDLTDRPEHILRSFRVNAWLLGEFMKTTKNNKFTVVHATNLAFQLFILKYSKNN